MFDPFSEKWVRFGVRLPELITPLHLHRLGRGGRRVIVGTIAIIVPTIVGTSTTTSTSTIAITCVAACVHRKVAVMVTAMAMECYVVRDR